MKIIKSVEIHRYRSISDSKINASDVTIFSGINNSGKSNILKALNLFFNGSSRLGGVYNFDLDYNKAYLGQAGGKREVKITLHFLGQGNAALKHPFSISKVFQANGSIDVEYRSTNTAIQQEIDKKNGNITRQFTILLNKIEYFYIPAVRDKEFVKSLFLHFEKLIEYNSGDEFKNKINVLSKILQSNSVEIGNDFEKFIGLPTQANLSSKITDLLGTVEIKVKTGIQVLRKKRSGKKWEDVFVDLFSSGDGILMSYLAYFLGHICKRISNKNFIWGFEEPENSLEYSKIEKLAKDFVNTFSSYVQIFITTHSPAFIGLRKNPKTVFYRVYIVPDNPKQTTEIKTLEQIDAIQRSLFKLGEVDKSVYRKLEEELHLIEFTSEIDKITQRLIKEKQDFVKLRENFQRKNKDTLNTFPSKVFICEDSSSKTIELWDELLKKFNLNDVKVLSSEGCTTMNVENWVKGQQKLNQKYNPKIFREIDRDGMTDDQTKKVKEKMEKSASLDYKIEFLPVYEIENFAVLSNKVIFDVKFWKAFKNKITRNFESKAHEKAKFVDKYFDYKDPDFRYGDGNYTKAMQNMRDFAENNWKKYFSGKDICKNVSNFNPISYLSNLKTTELPIELKVYINQLKIFYEN